MSKKPMGGLGRGLGSMLVDVSTVKAEGTSSINEVEISKIKANPNQPRAHFDKEALAELASSIKELGIIQPITLRLLDDGSYQIISGERRFRASQMIGLEKIPAYIRTAADQEVVEMALIENVQREDLNPIEIALSYQRLIEDYNLTHDDLSKRVGKQRGTITHYVGLLKLPAEIQMAVKAKNIDMGHAKALVSLKDAAAQLHIYEQIVNDSLSVRKVEELVRQGGMPILKNAGKAKKTQTGNEEYEMLEKQLSSFLKTAVQIKANAKGKGSISIQFKNDDEFEYLLELFDKLR
ncbi:MAG: ParB/RepB/Spo0J family partition protein [Prevotellaceae bacterium]|jgi:ParB family chromosome partitioning protein|nr:ParB/RepB/Spo0J family partition protein [Prevotellaceae bacterium]